MLLSNIALIRKYGFSLMENTMRYYRALIIADVIILQLDPDFNFVRHLKHYFMRRQMRRLRAGLSPESILTTTAQYVHLFVNGPSTIQRIIREYENDAAEALTRVDTFLKNAAHLTLVILVLVLVARVFRIHDVGKLVSFPVSLNWRWFSPMLFLAWRTFVSLSRDSG